MMVTSGPATDRISICFPAKSIASFQLPGETTISSPSTARAMAALMVDASRGTWISAPCNHEPPCVWL